MPLLQAVKLPTTMVTRLPFPFDQNELTVECGILTIKETSVKTLQIRLYSVIFNLSIKSMYNKKKKKFD